MSPDCFSLQVTRLRNRFGDNAFDSEFVVLLGNECRSMNNEEFARVVEMFIGNRKHNNPPLIVDFREARLLLEKEALRKTVQAAERVFNNKGEPLEKVLERQGFGGCVNLHEAIQKQIKKNNEPPEDDIA